MKTIDLNCDLGESFGAYTIGNDAAILPYVSSANIACGFHAGDPSVIVKTIEQALAHNVQIGAHPGFQDLVGFGRRQMNVSPDEAKHIVMYQISALEGMTRALGGKLKHVKPHGALYNMAAKDPVLARAIADAVYAVNPALTLYGLAGSHSITEAQKIGLQTASEAFADRTYTTAGTLTPRTEANALITHHDDALAQVLHIVKDGYVKSGDVEVPLDAQTICLHGDSAHALQFAKYLHTSLTEAGIRIQPIGGK